MALKIVTPPAEEPVDLASAKAHLRIDHIDEDALIAGYIKAAREYAETFTRRALATQTWKLTLDRFPSRREACYPHEPAEYYNSDAAIIAPLPPLQSVNSIVYIDADGASQTLPSSEYTTDTQSEPGRIVPAYSKFWPSTRTEINAVAVTFVCGYGAAAAVPQSAKQAILLIIGAWYENREAVVVDQGITALAVPMAADALLGSLRWGSYL